MEWIKKCPVLLLLAVSGVIFSLVGIIGRNSVYREYDFNIIERPFLALMMEGMSKDVAPWAVCGIGMGAQDGENEQILAIGDGQNVNGQVRGRTEATGFETDAFKSDGLGSGQLIGWSDEAEESRLRLDILEGENGQSNHSEQGMGTKKAEDTEDTQTVESYEFQTVTEDYFDDAVFIGDSRTVGLYEYAGMEERADFFAKISLTIYDVFTEKIVKDEVAGRKITVEDALSRKQYGKVYLMLGINELGTGTTESFMKEYKAVVDRLQELQPDAVIFVQGIMRVTGEKNEKDLIFNNTNINEKNAEIAKLADNERIFYIDVNEAVCDEDGNLNEEYTIDEIHLKAKYYGIWKDFLLQHGVVKAE